MLVGPLLELIAEVVAIIVDKCNLAFQNGREEGTFYF